MQKAPAGNGTPFLTDVTKLRERARQHIQAGAVTPNYGADPQAVIEVLNAALATEVVCVLRYKRHYFMAQGIASESVKAEFDEHGPIPKADLLAGLRSAVADATAALLAQTADDWLRERPVRGEMTTALRSAVRSTARLEASATKKPSMLVT